MCPFCVGTSASLIISYLGGTLGGISFNARPASNMPASGRILQIYGPTTRYRENPLDIGVTEGSFCNQSQKWATTGLQHPQHSGVPQCVWLHALQLQELSNARII